VWPLGAALRGWFGWTRDLSRFGLLDDIFLFYFIVYEFWHLYITWRVSVQRSTFLEDAMRLLSIWGQILKNPILDGADFFESNS